MKDTTQMTNNRFRSLTTALALLVAGSVSAFEPLVPYAFSLGKVDTIASDIRQIHARTGLKRFLLAGPGFNEVMYAPFASDLYTRMGSEIGEVKRKLAPLDIEIGFWCSPSIRYTSDFPSIEDAWGNKSKDNKKCPLDPAFQRDWASKIKAVAAAVRPAIINIEDDYTLAWGRGLNGGACFCKRHLADFAKRYGKALTGPEIAEAFKKRTPENLSVRKAWADTTRESLCTLAKKVRAAVDEVDPKIRILLCESGACSDKDGDAVEAIARAFAGSTRPGIRPSGAIYGAQTTPSDIPPAVSHTFYTLERTPKDVEMFYEADPYPHNRFFSSASQMLSLMASAIFAGSHNIQFYCMQYLDDPLEDPGYADAFNAAKPRIEAVQRFIAERNARLEGVQLVWRSEDFSLTHGNGYGHCGQLHDEAFLCGKMGLPYTTRRGASGPAILAGHICETMSDDEGRLPVIGENFTRAAGVKRPGQKVNAFYILCAGTEGTVEKFATLTPHSGTEVWSEFTGVGGKLITPSLTVARNSLGGRVAVLSVSLLGNRSSGLYNLRKQEMLKNLCEKLAPQALPVVALDAPGIWTLANVAADGKSMLVMVNNLSGDERPHQALAFSGKWAKAKISRLGIDGKPLALNNAAERWEIPFALGQMEPEYLLLEL